MTRAVSDFAEERGLEDTNLHRDELIVNAPAISDTNPVLHSNTKCILISFGDGTFRVGKLKEFSSGATEQPRLVVCKGTKRNSR